MKVLSYLFTTVTIASIIYLSIVLTSSFVIWEWKETIYNISCWDSFIRGWYLCMVVVSSAMHIIKEETSYDTY